MKDLRSSGRAALIGAMLMSAQAAQAIVWGSSTSAFGQVDTGVQITGNWVLTSRHAAPAVGGTYGNGYGSATVAARYDFSAAAHFPAHDLTLLRLGRTIAAPELALWGDALPFGVLATPLDVTITTGSNQNPRGYAYTQVTQAIERIDTAPVNYLLSAFTLAAAGAPYLQGGDSGGGLFLGHVSDSTAPLLGINSALLQAIDDQGQARYASGFVQIAAYRDWIDSTMQADISDLQVARWTGVSPVPEPSTYALWALGLAALGGLQRRRRPAL